MIIGTSIWTSQCSYDTCGWYQPYGWLSVLGLEVVVAWAFGILLLEVRPHIRLIRLRGFWRLRASTRPRLSLIIATLYSGLLGILIRWIWDYPPFYPENFLQDYGPPLVLGAVSGLLFALLVNGYLKKSAQLGLASEHRQGLANQKGN